MKQFIKIFSFALVYLLMSACEKDEQRVELSSETIGSELQASTASLILEKENLEDTVIVFSWDRADVGFDAAFSNVLQFDLEGNDFSSAREVQVEAGSQTKSFSKVDINSVFLSMDLKTEEASNVRVRLKSQIAGSAVEPFYSNPLALTVSPFSLVSYLYVPGGYQTAAPWDIETADSLISAKGNGIYTGVIHFPDSPGALEFKLAPAKSWTISYGDGGEGKINTTGGGNFLAPAPGRYQLTVDMNTLEIEFAPLQISIIGDAPVGSWLVDTEMEYDNGKQLWTLETYLSVGFFKFRKNADWNQSYGDTSAADGKIAADGENIPVTVAGDYYITLDLIGGSYTLSKK